MRCRHANRQSEPRLYRGEAIAKLWRGNAARASTDRLPAVHTQRGTETNPSEQRASTSCGRSPPASPAATAAAAAAAPPRLIPSVFHPTFTRCKKFRVPAKYSPSFEKAYVLAFALPAPGPTLSRPIRHLLPEPVYRCTHTSTGQQRSSSLVAPRNLAGRGGRGWERVERGTQR